MLPDHEYSIHAAATGACAASWDIVLELDLISVNIKWTIND